MNDLNTLIKYNVPKISPDTSIDEAVDLFKSADFSSLPVITSEGIPCGKLSVKSILSANGKSRTPEDITVKNIIESDIQTIKTLEDLELILRSNAESIDDIVIVTDNNGRYQGILQRESLLGVLYHDAKYIENILNSIDAGIVAIDRERKVVFYNHEWMRIHSVKDGKLLGEDILGKFPETSIMAVLSGDSTCISSEPLYFKYSGATVLPHYSAVVDEKNDIIGSVAIVKDYSKTSDIAVTVRELKTLNYHLSSIFNNLSEVVFSIDINKIISYANPVFNEMFGQKAGEILQNAELDKIISETIDRKMRTVTEKELPVHNRHNQVIQIAVSVLPLIDAQNTINGVVCIIQDMTSILLLKEKINYSNSMVKFYEKQLKKIPKDMVCENLAFKEVLATALKVAEIDVIVILEGESGVGKDVMANFIHRNSSRADRPFIPVNCGAIAENLWESEMFGYEEGSFTGAKRGGKLGLAELANKGTLYLDEIGTLSPAAQVKLLRFLENMEISKVGMKEIKKLDIRIIAASNCPLEDLVEQGKFRRDLYYRLNVIRLEIPPLRERTDEILPLAAHFLKSFECKYNKKVQLSPSASKILLNYQWPGNIRQLRNVIEHSVAMCDGVILPDHFPQQMIHRNKAHPAEKSNQKIAALPDKIREIEIQSMLDALKQADYNRTAAIKLLNISRKKFYKMLKEYGLEKIR